MTEPLRPDGAASQKDGASGVRVLQVVPGALWAGMERQVVALCDGLKQNGVHVEAAVWHDREPAKALRELDIPLHLLPQAKRGTVAIPLLCKLIDNSRFTIVHSHGYQANVMCWWATRKLDVGLVRTEHGAPEPFHGWKAAKMSFYRFLDARAARHTDMVVFVSDDLRRRIGASIPESKSTVWHNVLPGDAFPRERAEVRKELGYSDDEFIITAAGRFVPVKDFSMFCDVAVRLKGECRFVLFGEGPLWQQLQEESRSKGALVEFAGFRADFAALLPAFDLFLFTSIHEGLPTALLEALYCGVPVVAPPVGGIPEVLVGELAAGLSPERTVEDLAESCRKVLVDHDLRRRLSVAGRTHVKDFTPLRLGQIAKATYLEVLK